MKEVVKKCLKIENVTKISEFAEIFTEEVDTDLTMGNLVAFAERAILGGLSMDNVLFTTMPNTGVYVGKESYVQAKPEELLGLLNDSFNPYTEPLTMDALHILQYKSSIGYYTASGSGTGTTPIYTNPKPATVVTKPESTASVEPSDEPDPEESGEPDDPDDTPRPSGSHAPSASHSPEASSSPRPTNSNAPGGNEDPEESERPSHSNPPATGDPGESEPSSTPAPATAEPRPTPPASENQPAGIPMD